MFSFYKHRRVPFIKMDNSAERVCLDNLYSCENTKQMIRDILSEEFESTFDRLMRDAKFVKSLLAIPAKKHFEQIKTQYIEYGMKMKTLEDLKNILDFLRIWDEVDSSLNIRLTPEKSHICTE